MERQSKYFISMPVFSLEDGLQIGNVKEVVIDNKNLEIAALVINQKGFFRDQKIIPYVKVKNVGSDAITIERNSNATPPANLPHILNLLKNEASIIGTKAITEKGIKLGYVEECLIEDSTGKIIGFEITKQISSILGGKNCIEASFALTLGKDALIFKEDAEKALEPISTPLTGNFKNLAEKTTNLSNKVLEYSQKVSKKLADKLSKIAAEELPNHFKKKEPPISEDKKEPPENDLF